MRPDAINWRNTNELAALEFAPRHLIHRRVVAWIMRAMALQMILSVGLLAFLQVYPMADLGLGPRAAMASSPVPLGAAGTAATPSSWVSRALAAPTGRQWLRDAAAAQACAVLITGVLVIPLVQGRLRNRTRGLKDLFQAIRSMADGVTPKPLPAGLPGEAGYLAMAFNDMASRLMASRKQLTEANQTLERRVDERTRELREAAEKLEKMAWTDSLTGLANRRALADQGQSYFDLSVRRGTDLACCLIDLDDFKQVNDTLGHQKGDELICAAAVTIRAACGTDDVAARLGGDEFMVVMPSAELRRVTALAERIQKDFAQAAQEMFRGTQLKKLPSMSIGATTRKQCSAASFEELSTRADAFLYQAKECGKARIEIDTPADLRP